MFEGVGEVPCYDSGIIRTAVGLAAAKDFLASKLLGRVLAQHATEDLRRSTAMDALVHRDQDMGPYD